MRILKSKENTKTFIKDLSNQIKEHEIKYLAAETTYHFIIALVPFLIVLINLVSLFAKSQLDTVLSIFDLLPKETKDTLLPIVENIIQQSSSTLLSVGLIVALWSSSNALTSLIRAFNKAFDIEEENNFILKKVKAIFFTILVVLLIITVLLFMVFGDTIIGFIENLFRIDIKNQFSVIFSILRYLIPILGMILGFSLLFKYAPNFKKGESLHFKSAIAGGVVASIGWIIITLAYSFYVSNISNMSKTYGSLVGIFALFIWLNLTCKIMIIAAEFASSYDRIKSLK
ncbi:MAG: YihY/virulence factor BrkB family protein [Tissierellia bacterium]|nr:YihY/virulence factor BrkB family protein [Tissierellia bacterium]